MSATTFYGSDSYCIDDVQLIDTQVTDPSQLIAQRLARRLTTPYGALAIINDVADQGLDVRQYLNAKMTTPMVISAQNAIQTECLKDQQVFAVNVTLNFSAQSSILTIQIIATAATGQFSLTLNVGQLTTELIFGQ